MSDSFKNGIVDVNYFAGEQPTHTKLNAVVEQLRTAVRRLGEAVGDPYSEQINSGSAGQYSLVEFNSGRPTVGPNINRLLGSAAWLNPRQQGRIRQTYEVTFFGGSDSRKQFKLPYPAIAFENPSATSTEVGKDIWLETTGSGEWFVPSYNLASWSIDPPDPSYVDSSTKLSNQVFSLDDLRNLGDWYCDYQEGTLYLSESLVGGSGTLLAIAPDVQGARSVSADLVSLTEVGDSVLITGASNPENNGVFTITSQGPGAFIYWDNHSAVSEGPGATWVITEGFKVIYECDTFSDSYDGATFNVIPDPAQTSPLCTVSLVEGSTYQIVTPNATESRGRSGTHLSGTVTLSNNIYPDDAVYPSLADNYRIVSPSDNPMGSYQIELPYALTSNLSEGDVIPDGYIQLWDETDQIILSGGTFYYIDEHTVQVTGLNLTAGTTRYRLVVPGTNALATLSHLRQSHFNHRHTGEYNSFDLTHDGARISHSDLTDLWDQGSSEAETGLYPEFLPSSALGVKRHPHTQYLHRDGFRYNRDADGEEEINLHNALRGDLVLSNTDNDLGDSSDSYSIYFGGNPSVPDFSYGGMIFYDQSQDKLRIIGKDVSVDEDLYVTGELHVTEDAYVTEDLHVTEDLYVTDDAYVTGLIYNARFNEILCDASPTGEGDYVGPSSLADAITANPSGEVSIFLKSGTYDITSDTDLPASTKIRGEHSLASGGAVIRLVGCDYLRLNNDCSLEDVRYEADSPTGSEHLRVQGQRTLLQRVRISECHLSVISTNFGIFRQIRIDPYSYAIRINNAYYCHFQTINVEEPSTASPPTAFLEFHNDFNSTPSQQCEFDQIDLYITTGNNRADANGIDTGSLGHNGLTFKNINIQVGEGYALSGTGSLGRSVFDSVAFSCDRQIVNFPLATREVTFRKCQFLNNATTWYEEPALVMKSRIFDVYEGGTFTQASPLRMEDCEIIDKWSKGHDSPDDPPSTSGGTGGFPVFDFQGVVGSGIIIDRTDISYNIENAPWVRLKNCDINKIHVRVEAAAGMIPHRYAQGQSVALETGSVDTNTTFTITDNSKSWTTDQWAGYNVQISGWAVKIASNTHNTLTLERNFPGSISIVLGTSYGIIEDIDYGLIDIIGASRIKDLRFGLALKGEVNRPIIYITGLDTIETGTYYKKTSPSVLDSAVIAFNSGSAFLTTSEGLLLRMDQNCIVKNLSINKMTSFDPNTLSTSLICMSGNYNTLENFQIYFDGATKGFVHTIIEVEGWSNHIIGGTIIETHKGAGQTSIFVSIGSKGTLIDGMTITRESESVSNIILVNGPYSRIVNNFLNDNHNLTNLLGMISFFTTGSVNTTCFTGGNVLRAKNYVPTITSIGVDGGNVKVQHASPDVP